MTVLDWLAAAYTQPVTNGRVLVGVIAAFVLGVVLTLAVMPEH